MSATSHTKPAIFFTYDDHEFVNNYAGSSRDSGPYLNGSQAFFEYNAQTNFDPPDRNQFYYEFSYGADAAFFVLDTRRHRSTVEVDAAKRSMLGAQQLETFLNWLSKVRPKLIANKITSLMTQVNSTSTFKFVITSVPFTSLWTHDAKVDSWAAYAAEKAFILDALATVPNVIILSGDRHEFALVEFNHPSINDHRILEISTSPLSMYVHVVYIPRPSGY
jgi:alkaline phosphatase D